MSYKPNLKLFHSNDEIQEAIKFMDNALEECINYGTYLAGWLHKTTSKNEHDFPIYSTFLHFLDCLDSIRLLIPSSQSSGIKTLSRALFEASLVFRYLISNSRDKGVLAYQVSFTRKRISQRKMLDINEDKGSEFLVNFEKQVGVKITPQDSVELNKHLNAYLEREDILPIDKEWRRTKKKLKRVPNWYSLFDGPVNLKELANLLNEGIMYELLYSDLSQHIHGSNSTKNIAVVQQEEGKLSAISTGLRNPADLQDSIRWVLMTVMSTYTDLFNKYYPKRKKRFSDWYTKKFREYFISITSDKLFTITFEVDDDN